MFFFLLFFSWKAALQNPTSGEPPLSLRACCAFGAGLALGLGLALAWPRAFGGSGYTEPSGVGADLVFEAREEPRVLDLRVASFSLFAQVVFILFYIFFGGEGGGRFCW